MNLVRAFNEALDPIPVTLTLLIGGVIVWPAIFVAAAFAGIWIWMLPALIFPVLR